MARKVEIDRERLRRALEKRGYSFVKASKEMGFSDSYLNTVTKDGDLALHAIRSLEATFHIKPEEYAPADATPADVAQNEWARVFAILIKRTEPNELKELIKKAVREVLNE